ncbi:MAG: DUF4105 domain-containing protein [Paludibacteraceae bacterium]|nr:DUF4105 domain-containing protein [Paludibacteraceae bacterium]
MFRLLTITIWLLTCAPGEELYSRYGHTAIRVQDTETGIDLCYNYGTFSFNTDHFYWKFVKGETYYMLSDLPTSLFMEEYRYDRRTVYEQELDLTENEKLALAIALRENCRPENAEYLYNFVYDNCATRPFRLLQDVLQDSLQTTYTGWEGTSFRTALRHYTHPHSVINGLINMIFGPRANQPMSKEDALFLPEQLMFHIQYTTRKNGQPLVKNAHIAPFQIRQTHWWETIYPYLAIFAICMTLLSLYDRKRGKLSWGVDVVLGTFYALLLALVVFLRFFSLHPLVGFDWRLLIIPSIHLCTRLVYILRS